MIENKLKIIRDKLVSANIETYWPGQKQGECKKRYVVVRYAGSIDSVNISSSQQIIDILCYLPSDVYSQVESFPKEIEAILDELYPLLRPTNTKTAPFYNDSTKSYMVSLQFIYYTKNRR